MRRKKTANKLGKRIETVRLESYWGQAAMAAGIGPDKWLLHYFYSPLYQRMMRLREGSIMSWL